jgi:hypothetical protein
MRLLLYFIIYLLLVFPLQAEKVPAGYVAKWETIPLTDLDYKIKNKVNCKSFEGTLKKGKIEQPHISPFKIINETLKSFIAGYKVRMSQDDLNSFPNIDTVVIWPNYEQSNWYVLMGSESCFVKWIELQPDNIDNIISIGKKI